MTLKTTKPERLDTPEEITLYFQAVVDEGDPRRNCSPPGNFCERIFDERQRA
jgi:hypothetical protein